MLLLPISLTYLFSLMHLNVLHVVVTLYFTCSAAALPYVGAASPSELLEMLMDPYSYDFRPATPFIPVPKGLALGEGDESSSRLPWLPHELKMRNKGRRDGSSPTCSLFFSSRVLGWEILQLLQKPPTACRSTNS